MKVAIVGGGLSGLIAGKVLSEHGYEVEVLEADRVCGGLARSFEADRFHIPVFYHHIFSHDDTTLSVIRELGMSNQLLWKNIKMGITFGDTIYKISLLNTLGWDFLSFRDKMRLGKLYLLTKFKKDWADIEGLDARTWLEKCVGKNVADRIFKNIMVEKYGLPLEKVSASELAERLANEEAVGKFAYPKDGINELVKRLIRCIESKDGVVRTGVKIKKIDIANNAVRGVITTKQRIKSDFVVNTAPLPEFVKMAPGIPSNYAKQLLKIKYCRNICVDVGLSDHLGEFYWINCFGQDVGGIIEHTYLADIYPFKMAWVFKYAPPDAVWKLNNKEVARIFIGNMKRIFPSSNPLWYKVFRSVYASPIYDINYRKYMPDYTTPIRGLFMSGIALTYPKIRNMNTAFLSGIKTANLILGEHHA